MASEIISAQLLADLRRGDEAARDRLFSLVYALLREQAHEQLGRLRPGQTLGTTALVHETYLRLRTQTALTVQDQSHFFALCATVMRQILLDYARRRQTQKRGGGALPTPLHEAEEPVLQIEDRVVRILDLDAALTRLSTLNARLAQIVELRFFAGLSVEETARVLAVSERTVKEDWRKARAFLYRVLYPSDAP